MMKANLYIAYTDLEKYLNGQGIKAAPKETVSAIFEYSSRQDLLEVSVDVTEIIASEEEQKRGFIHGNFNYYIIQKGDSK